MDPVYVIHCVVTRYHYALGNCLFPLLQLFRPKQNRSYAFGRNRKDIVNTIHAIEIALIRLALSRKSLSRIGYPAIMDDRPQEAHA